MLGPPLAFSVAETSVAEMSGPKRPRPKCPWPKCPTFDQDQAFNTLVHLNTPKSHVLPPFHITLTYTPKSGSGAE